MSSTQHAPAPGLTVVVPVKRLARAKTRLDLPPQQRRRVALELASGSVRTLLASPSVSRVLVVTSDPRVARFVRRLGAGVVWEPWWPALTGSRDEQPSLNRAARLGRRTARLVAPDDDVAVVVSDLPSVTTLDIETVVSEFRASRRPLLVADQEGLGTTMLIHPAGSDPTFHFGAGSADRHRAAGFTDARSDIPGLRRDLDLISTP